MEKALFGHVSDQEIEEEVPFRLSWGFDLSGLRASLARVGQVSPLVLQPQKGRYHLVCGLRRRLALRELGRREFTALILPETMTPQETFLLALEENLGHRRFNDAEKALALNHLAAWFEPPELTAEYLPRLGLPPRQEVLDRFLALPRLGPKGLSALARGDLDPESGELLLSLDPPDRAAVLALLAQLRPGLNKRRQILTWLLEISLTEQVPPGEVLAADDLRAVLEDPKLGRREKEKRFRHLLRLRRYPRLTAAEKEQAALLGRLDLPPNVTLIPPRNFEGLGFTLQLSFADLEDLRAALKTANRLAASPDLAALLELG